MKKLTSIWQIDEIMVEKIREISAKRIGEKNNVKEKRYLTYEGKLDWLLQQYNKILKSYTHRDDGISLWEEKDIRAYVNDKLRLTLKALFDYYMKGKIIESNKCANRLFNVSANRLSAKSLFPIVKIDKDTYWFRARKPEEEKFQKKDLFHVPFEKREYIGTNRFSISGYPCLYLASTMEAAREETGNLGIMAVSCFQNKEEIDVYDFTFFPNRHKEDWQSIYRDIMTYPFKIAAAIPTIPKEDGQKDGFFKEEYIIPQLLLHCVIRQSGVRKLALQYSSTKSILNNVPKEMFHRHVNLVAPAFSIRNKGYCSYLSNKFVMTEPQIVPFSYLTNEQVEIKESQMKGSYMEHL